MLAALLGVAAYRLALLSAPSEGPRLVLGVLFEMIHPDAVMEQILHDSLETSAASISNAI